MGPDEKQGINDLGVYPIVNRRFRVEKGNNAPQPERCIPSGLLMEKLTLKNAEYCVAGAFLPKSKKTGG